MQEPDDLPNRESKSRRKKEMLALQKMGEILVQLAATQLAKIPLVSPLAEAIATARQITSHEGKRRQLQYIGKLMRNVDTQPIQEALDKVLLQGQTSKAKFHQVERWRDKCISEGDTAQQEFMEKYPDADRQQLRQLIRNAQQDKKTGKNLGAETALFRFLREIIEAK
jgi:ribosome-associated protein